MRELRWRVQNEVKRLRQVNWAEVIDAPSAVKLIRKAFRDLPRDEFKVVKEIVLKYHLRPSMRKPGIFMLQEADLEPES